jgi:hypothetical protein
MGCPIEGRQRSSTFAMLAALRSGKGNMRMGGSKPEPLVGKKGRDRCRSLPCRRDHGGLSLGSGCWRCFGFVLQLTQRAPWQKAAEPIEPHPTLSD